jgi:hypothetical protein
LFWTIRPRRGSKVSADEMRPTSKTKLLNCRARATSWSAAGAWPENWCETQAWR